MIGENFLWRLLEYHLTDDRLKALKKLSAGLNISPEELVRLNIEDMPTLPDEAFQQTMNYVL